MLSNGVTVCKDSSDYTFTIEDIVATDFGYNADSVCGGAALDTVMHSGTPGGTFAAFPDSAGINIASGQITPAAMTLGSHIITYTPPIGTCESPSDTTIYISPSIQGVFNYLEDSVCIGSGTIGPFVTSAPSNGSYSILPVPAIASAFNTVNGFINLDSMTAGTYVVSYDIPPGLCVATATDTVIVKDAPNVTFTMPSDTMCASAAAMTMTPPGATGAFFNLDGNLSVTGNTVVSNLSLGGPYLVYFRDTLGHCIDSSSQGITIIGSQNPVIQYGATSYCQNDINPTPTFISGSAGGFYSSVTLLPNALDSASGIINLDSASAGTNYVIYYVHPDTVCPDSSLIATIDILAPPAADFGFAPDSICFGDTLLAFAVQPADSNHYTVTDGTNYFNDAISAAGLQIDSLPPGTYEIQNIRTSPTCTDTAYDYITVNRVDVADIYFDPQIICFGDADPYPFNAGDGGGIFTADTVKTGFGFNVVDTTGIINITAALDTTYYIYYQTSGVCPSRDSASVSVRQKIDAFFQYGDIDYCILQDTIASNDTIPTDTIANSTALSTFTTATPGLVFIPGGNGAIDLLSSAPGTYNVSRKIQQSGACADEHIVTLTLVAEDTVTDISVRNNPFFPSTPDVFCSSHDTAYIDLVGDTTGLFSSSTGLFFYNINEGLISLRASVAGQHEISYRLTTACNEIWKDTLTILASDDASFNYSNTGFCNGGANEAPTFEATPGTYSISPAGALTFVDTTGNVSLTGELDIFQSFTTGFLYVLHTTNGVCASPDSVLINLSPQPTDAELVTNPSDNIICEGQTVGFRANGGGGLYRFFRNDTTAANLIGNNPDYSFTDWTDGETMIVEFSSLAGCRIFDSSAVQVFPIPADTILGFDEFISASDPISVEVMSLTPQTEFTWAVTGLGDIEFDSTGGTVGPRIDSGMVTMVMTTASLESDINPASVTIYITPQGEECIGVTDTIVINVNPNNLDIFVPQVITPDGNDKNDIWQIQFKNGILPSNYIMKLYNEAGSEVFQMSPVRSDFNGETLPDAVYWYILSDLEGNLIEAGGLTIRRK